MVEHSLPEGQTKPGVEELEPPTSASSVGEDGEVPEPDDPFLGSILDGKYKLLSLVGGGGVGLVYRAEHLLMSNTVAVKVLFPHMSVKADAVRRFQQEAKATSLLSDPNIVAVHDFGLHNATQPYLVMEFLDGISLSDLIAEQGRLPVELALDIISQACSALSHAHEKGIVHRDLKPSNLMLVKRSDGNYFVKVVDFGLAKPVQGSSKLTQTGDVFGSPSYMSPEQCRAIAVDFRSDIYSIGCVLYEALTGAPPFVEPDPISTILKHMEAPPPELSIPGVPANVRERLQKIVLKTLAKDKEHRYQTMNELKKDLDACKAATNYSALQRLLNLLELTQLRWAGVARRIFAHKIVLVLAIPLCLMAGALVPIVYLLSQEFPEAEQSAETIWIQPQVAPAKVAPPAESATSVLSDSTLSQMAELEGQASDSFLKALEKRASYFLTSVQYDKAQHDLKMLYKIKAMRHGRNDLSTATTLKDLGDCCYSMGNTDIARRCYDEALPAIKRSIGPFHKELARPEARLAEILASGGNLKDAETHYTQALSIWRRFNATTTPEYNLAMSRLAQTYEKNGQFSAAYDCYREAYAFWSTTEGDQYTNAAYCLGGMARTAEKQDLWHQAGDLYKQAVPVYEKTFGENSPQLRALLEAESNVELKDRNYLGAISTRWRIHNLPPPSM